jgi:SAM-dependent methyltransferase
VADAYAFRPPYPPAVFGVLGDLLAGVGGAGRILDVGCGTGGLARFLTTLGLGVVVDAVDVSDAMIERGRLLDRGDDPRVRWHLGTVDRVPLQPPYDLITAGESLHWLDWDVTLPLLAGVLERDGLLVTLELGAEPLPWDTELGGLIRRYSTNRDYEHLDLTQELTRRGLFVESGRTTTAPWLFRQTVAEYVESFHGRASFSRARMSAHAAREFDRAIAELAGRQGPTVELLIIATLVWGRPTARTTGRSVPGRPPG